MSAIHRAVPRTARTALEAWSPSTPDAFLNGILARRPDVASDRGSTLDAAADKLAVLAPLFYSGLPPTGVGGAARPRFGGAPGGGTLVGLRVVAVGLYGRSWSRPDSKD